jgi:hypothetical protein
VLVWESKQLIFVRKGYEWQAACSLKDWGPSFRWARRQWREAGLSPPSGVRLRMPVLRTHYPQHTCMTCTQQVIWPYLIFYIVLPLSETNYFYCFDSTCWAFLLPSFLRSHSETPHSVGLLWASDRPVANTSTWQHKNTHNELISMLPAVFEPAIPATQIQQKRFDQNLHDNKIH